MQPVTVSVAGAEIVSTFDAPSTGRLGTCDLIEETQIGEDRVLRFSGCALNAACTIVLRGSTQQLLDEAERSLHDALCVLYRALREPMIVYVGGHTLHINHSSSLLIFSHNFLTLLSLLSSLPLVLLHFHFHSHSTSASTSTSCFSS